MATKTQKKSIGTKLKHTLIRVDSATLHSNAFARVRFINLIPRVRLFSSFQVGEAVGAVEKNVDPELIKCK